jgi:hypothetical protein
MKREEAKEKIIAAIKANFEVKDDKFIEDETNFIQISTNRQNDDSRDFADELARILNDIFPDNPHPISVSMCDCLEDILRNNFKFEE